MLINFQNCFTAGLSKKFATKLLSHFSPTSKSVIHYLLNSKGKK